MPPSGIDGVMDDDAVIEAEIYHELENINLDDDIPPEPDVDDIDEEDGDNNFDVENELDDYIKKLQDQSNRFEEELLECDEILAHNSDKTDGNLSNALVPYEDHDFLLQLAQQHGCDVEEYKRKILEDIENDEVLIEDELKDFIDDDDDDVVVNNDNTMLDQDVKLPVKITQAVEEGIDREEVPVSQELVTVNGLGTTHQKQLEMQQMLKDELVRLESRYEDRMIQMKKDEEFRKDEENVREKRSFEERMWKKEELDREEKQMIFDREMADRERQKEQEKAKKEMEEQMRKFELEMATLQAENEHLRREHELAVEMERQKLAEKQDIAVINIQRVYRGYRARKDVGPLLSEQREIRKKHKQESRIKEVELEIEKRKEEQKIKEEEERQRQEEIKREKEEEKKRLEEEKRLKKEEAERIKKEEKRKKEEEKQRKKEEERQRKEEEKLKKEEEKRKKEEEKRRKEEEKRQKEVEEKRQKEEEKRRKEAEEKKQKDEEELKKREEKQKLEEEKKQHEKEQTVKEENDQLKLDSDKLLKMESMVKEETKNGTMKGEEKTDKFDKNCEEKKTVPDTLTTIECVKTDDSLLESKTKSANNNNMSETSIVHNDISKSCTADVEKHTNSNNVNDKPSNNEVCDDDRNETPRSTHKPKSARSRPSTPRKGKKEVKTSENKDTTKKPEINADCLPPDLELLRLNFIKECLPWSKVSNEPWKLKAGLSRKPLRRPSSAKKLPTLPEDVIIQSAKVASLKMVTTVELQDLPGYNISTLGQCGGLKYLTLNHCNLITLDGLTQCKQLQYINVKNNKIEYVDLKDLGQLQYLNISQNKLSSIHGLDNCTNLRWLDLSYNNITKLGGMDTLRRLCYINISHCQLISTQGIHVVPTVQMLDVSNNHLQMLEDIDKLCLLLTVNASANNIQQIPNFKNQVLLLDVDLSNNSLCTLSGLGSIWLPVLCSLKLDQNSLADLPVLQNCLLLKELNLIENQITDTTTVLRCVNQCYYLEELNILDNPVVADLDDSYYSKLEMTCPRLSKIETRCTERQHTPLKPRNSIETMCLSQQSTLKDCFHLFQHNISAGITDQTTICDVYYKLCDKIFNMAVEYRYIHEYGEVTFIPSAPSLPKSGRPVSARQREKFVHPKDLFENALKSQDHSAEPNHLANKNENKSIHNYPKDLFENALKLETRKDVPSTKENVNTSKPLERLNHISQNSYSNPKDLFEQALKSADTSSQPSLFNGHTIHRSKQSEDIYNNAAVMIQAVWRGYKCRKILHKQGIKVIDIDPELVERIYNSAVKIQANWRGYILRKKLLAALEYAQCDFDDNDDNDMIDFGDEFDLDKFVDFNQDLLDTDWRPPSTPDIPNNYAVLRKPPSGKPQVPRINTSDVHPPNNPRRAWRNVESPISDLGGKIPRPPSSLASTQLTVRSAVSKKEEQMAEEWGFKDNTTAHLMMQRAKKMKYNSERRQKINKLDPKQRLALFRKLEEVTRPVQYTMKPSRKTLPRKEYFQARQEEIVRQDREKHEEYQVKASRTFEWLHSQVGDHVVTDSVINQRHTEGPKYINPDNNLPELIGGGKRIHLVSSPMSVELQSVDSVSSAGKKGRRFSAGSGSGTSKLPPILPTSAPVPQVKEKMSFRNAPVNQSVGWGGGKKRGQLH